MSQPEEGQPQSEEAQHSHVGEVVNDRQRFEQEKMSCRAALRKLGITSAVTVLGVFAADDLARMAIRVMEENKSTSQLAEVLAHDFNNAGVALAITPGDLCRSQASTAFQICMNVAQNNFNNSNPIFYPINIAICLTAQAQCRANYQNNFTQCETIDSV